MLRVHKSKTKNDNLCDITIELYNDISLCELES